MRLRIATVAVLSAMAVARAQTPTAVGRMNIARSSHQATLLLDGRVLVSGGSDAAGRAIAQAEVFNPSTAAWSLAAANARPRSGHVAVLLRDGRVLVVGGASSRESCDAVESAELYDVAIDRWTSVPSPPLRVGRGSIAITLTDGRVLVAGGGAPCDAVSGAALFDPAINAWQPTAPMITARQFHVATLLVDGRVLVSGGALTAPSLTGGARMNLSDNPRMLFHVAA
jgi:hypothetical protein